MVKTKRDVDAFQKAMLSNTKVIGSESSRKNQTSTNTGTTTAKKKQADSNTITSEILRKYEAFAKELNINTNDAIELALNHFLELKGFLSK